MLATINPCSTARLMIVTSKSLSPSSPSSPRYGKEGSSGEHSGDKRYKEEGEKKGVVVNDIYFSEQLNSQSYSFSH